MEDNELLGLAYQARSHSYAPYSNFHVGACILCADGHYFMGANVENASYGVTNCAERNAVFAAYSYGYRKQDLVRLAIVADGSTIAAPCGACRQVLSELVAPDMPIILSNGKQTVVTTIARLMPMSFGPGDLH